MATTETITIHRSRPSLWHRVTSTVRSYWSGSFGAGDRELARLWSGATTTSGVSVDELSALTYSAVWAAVSLISSQIASVPLILYQRLPNEGGKKRYTAHSLYRLLHDEPNPEMTSMVFRETLQAHVLTWGNGYAEIERNGVGSPVALWPLAPNRVTPFRTDGGALRYAISNPTGADVTLDPFHMLHIPGLGFDGTCGYSPVAKARESIGLGIATQQFGNAFFGNGSTFGGFFTATKPMNDNQRKNFRASMIDRHQGLDRAHRFALLEEGMTYTQLGVPAADAQYLETRQFQIEEIARWYNLAPYKLKRTEGTASYASIEQQAIEHVTDCLRQWWVRWEQEINRKLVSRAERNQQFAEHLIEGILRGDQKSRYDAYAVGRQWGWLSVNDIRRPENLNPIPGGDVYLVPMNMVPADRIDEFAAAQIEKAKAKPQPPASGGDRSAEIAALETRLDAANQSVADARDKADEAQRRVIALEATGTATASELQAARESEQRAATLAAQLTGLADSLRADHAAAAAARDAIAAERDAERIARELAEQREIDARAAAERAAEARIAADVAAAEASTQARTAEFVATQAEADRLAAEQRAADLASALATATATLTVADTRATELAGDLHATTEARQAADADAAVQRRAVETLTAQFRGAQQDADDAKAALKQAHAEAVTQVQEATAQAQRAAQFIAELERQLADAQRTVTDTTATATGETAARQAAEAALEAQRAAEQTRMLDVVTANRRLFVRAMERVIRRETDRARKAQASPEKLRHWAETFYPLHETIACDELLPVMDVHLKWMQSGEDAVAVTRTFVQQYIVDSRRQLALVSDSDTFAADLEQTLQWWESARAEQMADTILRAELEHVRRAD